MMLKLKQMKLALFNFTLLKFLFIPEIDYFRNKLTFIFF